MALKTAFEVEAWSLPGVGAFASQVAAIPVVDVQWSEQKNSLSSGSLAVSPYYASIDSICDPDNNVETLIRVKVDGTYAYAFFARDRTDNFDDTGLTRISGPGLEDILNQAIVYPYDYPVSPSLQADWIFGSTDNGLRNGDFEDIPEYVSNNTFETGTTVPWQEGDLATFEVNTSQFHTGTQSLQCTPTAIDGSAFQDIPVYPNSLYLMDVWVLCPSGATIEVGASVPGDIKVPTFDSGGDVNGYNVVGSSARPRSASEGALVIAYENDISDPTDANYGGVEYVEMQLSITGSGTWQHVILAFWSGNGQNTTRFTVRNASNTNAFHLDDFGSAGNGIGLNGWQIATAGASTLQASMPSAADIDNVDQDTGSWCASIGANKIGQGIRQVVSGVQPGHKYTVSARIKSALTTHNYRLVVTDVLHRWIASDVGGVAVNNTYSTFEATFTLPTTLPGDGQLIPANSTIIVKVVMGDTIAAGTTRTFFVDNVSLVPGGPAVTIGDILDQLLADAAVDHIADGRTTAGGGGHLAWLSYDFDFAGDSALPSGSVWATPNNPSGLEAVNIKRGMSYLQFCEQVVARLGYDWRVIITPGNTFLLQVYIPDGGGLDLTSTVSLVTGSVGPSSLGLNGGSNSVVFGEGKDRLYYEQTNATDVTNYGRREVYLPVQDVVGLDTLKAWVDTRALAETGLQEGHRIELNDASMFTPYVDFHVADDINVNLGARLTTRNLQVKGITARLSDDQAQFGIDINSDPPKGRALPHLTLARMLRRFQGIDDDFKFGGGALIVPDLGTGSEEPAAGGGTVPTYFVAASNARTKSQDSADYLCDGVDDNVQIQLALDACGTLGHGRVVLSEGLFNVKTLVSLTVPADCHLMGLGAEVTSVTFHGDPTSTTYILLSAQAQISSFDMAKRSVC